jgi:hypothetical protein
VNSVVFGLKPIKREQDRYIFIRTDQAEDNYDLRVYIKTHQGQLKEGVAVVDFIETYGHRALNRYEFAGAFQKSIQVKARIFATFDSNDIPFSIVVEGT